MRGKRDNQNAIELKELVYAPLQAVAEANMRLSAGIVDFLASTGDVESDEAGNPTVHLKTMQMQYKQLRSDAEENSVAERIGLEIPLLSIYPISSLQVSKTKVAFNVEVKNTRAAADGVKIYTQVSSKNRRKGASHALFSYDVELQSVPVSEGLARFIDTLNAQAMPKRLSAKPLDGSGNALTGKELEEYNRRMEVAEREKEIAGKIDEAKEVIRGKNNILNAKTGMDYDDYMAHLDYTGEKPQDEETAELCADIGKYREICGDLETELDGLRTERLAQQFQSESEPEPQKPKQGPQRSDGRPSGGGGRK